MRLRTLLLLACFLAVGTSTVASAQNPNGWTFVTHCFYGRCKASVTYDSACLDNGVFRYLVKAPDVERLTIMNDDNHRFMSMTTQHFIDRWCPRNVTTYPKLVRLEDGKIDGFNCRHYHSAAEKNLVRTKDSPRRNTVVDYWCTEDIRVNEKLANSICRVCFVPQGYGMPVRCDISTARGKMRMFQMLRAKETVVSSAAINIPKSYQPTKDEAVMFFGELGLDSRDTDVTGMFRSSPAKLK